MLNFISLLTKPKNNFMEQEFNLIRGNFKTQEAKEILTELFSSKIRFHELKNFRSNEHFGVNDEIALIRLKELKDSIDKINKLLSNPEHNQKTVSIETVVKITLK